MNVLINEVSITNVEDWWLSYEEGYDMFYISTTSESNFLDIVDNQTTVLEVLINNPYDNESTDIEFIGDKILYLGLRTCTDGSICKTAKFCGKITKGRLELKEERRYKPLLNLKYALFMNEHDVDYEQLTVNYSKDNSYDKLTIKGDLREDVKEALKIRVYDEKGPLFEFKVDEILNLDSKNLEANGKIILKR